MPDIQGISCVCKSAGKICHLPALFFGISDEKMMNIQIWMVGWIQTREKKRAPFSAYDTRDGLRSATRLRVTEKWDEHAEEESV